MSCLLIVLTSVETFASPAREGLDPFSLSLEELLSTPIETASIEPAPLREQPATLSVMTRADIESLGARNLLEILEHVPGVSFGVDVFGVSNLIFRGLWAHEGKVLVLIDDLPINDLSYGTLNLGWHYPADQIDRVEVLRGAGTARYGGNAQLAVIKVFTSQADQTGFELNLSANAHTDAGIGRKVVATGTWVGDELSAMVSASHLRAPWSGRTWRDSRGTRWDLEDFAEVRATNLITKIDWKRLHYRLLLDEHVNETPQRFGFGIDGEEIAFRSLNHSLSYDWIVRPDVRMTSRVEHRRQEDWYIDRDPSLVSPPPFDFEIPAERLLGSFEAAAFLDEVDLLGGLEVWNEEAWCASPGGVVPDCGDYFGPGQREQSLHGHAAFLTADWNRGALHASLGARFSSHSYAGESLVPRASVVYLRQRWHLKVHSGQAFREPDLDVIRGATPGVRIQPETTTQHEIELGLVGNTGWLTTLSFFRTEIDDPIFYSSLGTDSFTYSNQESVATEGLEVELRGELPRTRLHASYSFYRAVGTPVENYRVPGDDDAHLGAPQHKLALSLETSLVKSWTLHPSVVWTSGSSAYDFDPDQIDAVGNHLSVQKSGSRTLANLITQRTWVRSSSNASSRSSWTLSLGVIDLLDEGRVFPQPYHSESTPYPGAGRQVWLRLRFNR